MSTLTTVQIPEIADAQVSDFDGWSREELTSWLEAAVSASVRVTAVMRHRVGLALWHLRKQLPDGDYGAEVERLARACSVSERTLGDWRLKAERAFGLPSPDARSRARQFMEAKRERGALGPGDATPASPPTHSEPPSSNGHVMPPTTEHRPATQRGEEPVLSPPSVSEVRRLGNLVLLVGIEGWAKACTPSQLTEMVSILRAALRLIEASA